ncbi:glycoside hydrolase family 5 protein [Bosea sp. (in: a-proteobacteria)]|uniref:glycoside hydrolase family 5 protein n=1 Tax=Bosea sp. (in: a-proteobacteria) TaxID=1871050 RepID=UPI001210BF6C|nr:glycoside hydrolase family 5 protein [Bosea sp. (in: a-proteobacteria)]TAJ28255.1 MAG: glycoside hydrolase family 5 protein [Bosea sp. (in: a-proteobacteria)]
MRRLVLALVAALLAAPPAQAEMCLRGVNLSGAEFGDVPGKPDKDYTYPAEAAFKRLAALGAGSVRLPFRWERLQPALGEGLDIMELARLDQAVRQATDAGLVPILDLHNFGYYDKRRLGSKEMPAERLGDVWRRLASHYKDRPKLVFSIMNEPYDIHSAEWARIQNVAVAAIRQAGAGQLILVTGTAYGGAHSWTSDLPVGNNGRDLLDVKDPLDRYAYDFHQYLDADFSGRAAECSAAQRAVTAIDSVTAWLKQHDRRGFLGEFASSSQQDCLAALGQLAARVDAHPRQWVGWAYWGAGAWWPPDYIFNIEPTASGERPQMKVLIDRFRATKGKAVCGREARP